MFLRCYKKFFIKSFC